MLFEGVAFAPRSSERHFAQLDVSQANHLSLKISGDIVSCDLEHADISAPLGKLPVEFTFPNGWIFTVERSEDVDQWLASNQKSSLVDKMESNWIAWLLSAIMCLCLVLSFYFYILPWTSDKVAKAIPEHIALALGDKILESLDSSWEESEISSEEQHEILLRITQHLAQLETLPYPIEVEFRASKMGANAFALPGGKVVLLDEIVELAQNKQQLDSIILHEIGHIYHRHMLKKLVHSSLLSVGVSLLTGESSGVVDNLAGLGVFFLSNGHSREAELEADVFSKQAMLSLYGTSQPLAEMFELLHEQNGPDIPEWMSTHPDFEQRIQAVHEQ